MTEPLLPPPGPPGEHIGPYRLLEILGEGGMGTVYLAEQTEPLRRRVALKLIRPGMVNRRSLHRFEAERQALARMNHPNVAQVYEAGDTELGQPYIVMEYVPGLPITDFCNRHRLSVEERLELFAAVCGGIQHAHQKGVIHRDIKPSNILVVEAPESGEDGTLSRPVPIPKVIDFGIAKGMEEPLTAATQSLTGDRMLGTPAYLSPEAFQVLEEDVDVDTRSDVYALGVLLYELLVDELPYGSKKESLLVAVRRIASEDPVAPSVRFAELDGMARDARAAERRLGEQVLLRKLRGDLDWITLKAIAKERSERYVSAAELAEDIARFRADEPVVAGPPSGLYRARKFVRRHLWAVAAAVALLVALIVGFAARTVEAERANREAARANREATRANREAEAARRYGEEADGVVRFLVDVFDVSALGSSRGETVTASELLATATGRLRQEYRGQPLTQARLMDTMGVVYRKLGLYDEAEPLLTQSLAARQRLLGESHVDVARSLGDVATLYWLQGRYDEAEPLARRALEIREQSLGPEHPDVAQSLDDLALVYRRQGSYDDAEPLFQRALAIREKVLGGEHRDVAETLNGLAILHWNQGRYDDAAPLFQRALAIWEKALGPSSLELAATLNNLAGVYRDQGRYDDAEPLYQRALEIRRQTLGPDHPSLGYSLSNLALLYRRQGRYREAEPLYQRALEIWEGTLGPEHPDVAFLLNNLALLYDRLGRRREAEPISRRALALNEKLLGPEHPSTASSVNILAIVLAGRGKVGEAERLHRRALGIYEEALGSGHQRVAWPLHGLAELCRQQGRFDEAERLYQRAFKIRRETLGAKHPDTRETVAGYAALLRATGRGEEAAALEQGQPSQSPSQR